MKTLEQVETLGDILDRLPEPKHTLPPEVRAMPLAIAATAPTPMQMLQTAVEKGASVEMLERLMGLQERWEANEARKAFVAALNAFKARPPTIVKNKSASFGQGKTAYDYATLDQVCAVIGSALAEHGLSHRWETKQADGKIAVTCVLTHELGHSERVTLEAGADTSGSKNAIQAIGSAVTYLQRYTLLSATGLAASEQDDDGGHADDGDLITPEQKADLIALLKETKRETASFLAYVFPRANIQSLDEIPAARFADAKTALENVKAKLDKKDAAK